MSNTPKDLDTFLAEATKAPDSRCIVSKHPELIEDLKRYAAGRADGSISISTYKLFTDYIRPKYGVKSVNSIYRYLREELGADV